jgi:hypothetical protein
VDKACRGVDKETEEGRIMQKSKARRKSGQGPRIQRRREICRLQRSRQGVSGQGYGEVDSDAKESTRMKRSRQRYRRVEKYAEEYTRLQWNT